MNKWPVRIHITLSTTSVYIQTPLTANILDKKGYKALFGKQYRHVHATVNVIIRLRQIRSDIPNSTFQLGIKCDIKFLPVVSLEDTSPKGEGSIRRYFWGEETGDMIGAHLLLLGEAGLMIGSKSRVLFSVAPQAMAPNVSK